MSDKVGRRVFSGDGVEIAYWSSGAGPPLVLVHGGLGDHTRWDALRPHLEPHFTVHAMDRRGRGGSGDHPDYALWREYADVAAVIDAVTELGGSPVDVYCSSFGGLCAFGAAALTSNLRRLALYEAWPPVNPAAFAPPAGLLERMEGQLADDNAEAALKLVYREVVGLSEEQLAEIRAQPSWPARVAAAHTFPREERVFASTPFDPEQAASITVPTLLLVGTDSPTWGPEAQTVETALPDARIVHLEGQGHAADLLAPEIVAEQLLAFFDDH